ncbi:MAG: rhodanese-like domain-containing protein [Bacteroidia bacterium]
MNLRIIMPLFIAMFTVLACGNSSSSQQEGGDKSKPIAKDLNVAEFEKMIDENPGTVLDVRTPDEYKKGNIEGSVLIDWYSPDFAKKAAELDKDKPVYVYCHVGGRSSSAMKKLTKELGFTEVYNLKGGIVAWRNVH